MSNADSLYWGPETLAAYKWQDAKAIYPPTSPWLSRGRFSNADHKALYLAETAKGAISEYFHRHPELLEFQDKLAIKVFEVKVDVHGSCLDLRREDARSATKITLAQVTSSIPNEEKRYAACRALAQMVVRADGTGIVYPSAAAAWVGAWNLVLFGDQSAATWTASEYTEVTVPIIDPDEVIPLER